MELVKRIFNSKVYILEITDTRNYHTYIGNVYRSRDKAEKERKRILTADFKEIGSAVRTILIREREIE